MAVFRASESTLSQLKRCYGANFLHIYYFVDISTLVGMCSICTCSVCKYRELNHISVAINTGLACRKVPAPRGGATNLLIAIASYTYITETIFTVNRNHSTTHGF